MRAFAGFLILCIQIPLFIVVLFYLTIEWNNIQSLHKAIQRQVHIQHVSLSQNSYMYDENGIVFSEMHDGEKRKYLPIEHIPQTVVDIFLTTEDRHFYQHHGFDIGGIIRAFTINLKSQSIEQGGSTITQQLARNLFLTHEKSYKRKINELLYAYQLEKQFSKKKILELYLNSIYFGHGIYGIDTASHYYFQKDVHELTLGEMSFLCAIPNNPSFYDPLSVEPNTKSRQQFILKKLAQAKKIDRAVYEKAMGEPITLNIEKNMDLYPDYTTYVYEELKELIADQEGFTKQIDEAVPEEKRRLQFKLKQRVQEVLRSGVHIYTGLSRPLQEKGTSVLKQALPMQDVNGAIVVLNHQTHQISAIIGGKNYKKLDFHRAYQAVRQPGSAIKPLLVYVPYINEYGATENSLVDAGPFCLNGYCPQNASGRHYGMTTLKTAFKYSYNTPAVRLLNQVGVEKGFQYMEPFQFQHIVPKDHNLTAAVGGFTYGVTPLELTNAYTVFSNNGKYTSSRAILKVTDAKGKILYKWQEPTVQVWKSTTNTTMRKLLAEVINSGTAKKIRGSQGYAGGKTGTTNDYKDLWFIGMKDRYTVGVWIGSDKPKSNQRLAEESPHLFVWKRLTEGNH
ncbi:transglycosylase domain-containing protein [Bacillus songklensis]|uniref:Transglycosylase domain-containing protein n=1 Tax=Bacillus songklensis TaxID=1069116 RepID=A0ABV8BB40_9BACI